MATIDAGGDDARALEPLALRYRALVGVPGTPIWELALDGTITNANTAAAELLGYEPDDLIGLSYLLLLLPEEQEEVSAIFASLASGEADSAVTRLTLRGRSGDRHVVASGATVRSGDGTPQAIVGGLTDITDQINGHRHALELIDSLADLVIVLSPSGRIVFASRGVEEVLGDPLLVTGDLVFRMLHPADIPAAERAFHNVLRTPGATGTLDVRVRHADGSWRLLRLRAVNEVDNPEVGGIVVAGRDITERQELELALARQTMRDELTELPNRRMLLDVLHVMLRECRDPGSAVAVLHVDLDRFSRVNDSLGHTAGDEVLRAVAALFDALAPVGGIVARAGADEFTIAACVSGEDEAAALADALLASLRVPFAAAGREVEVTASVGVALGVPTAVDADELLRNAGAAVQVCKHQGGNRWHLSLPGAHLESLDRLEMESELRRALAAGAVDVHYQPEIDLATGTVVGLEALVRWNRPGHGVVAADRLVGVAEQSDLILLLGEHVLRTACAAAQRIGAAVPGSPPFVAVNLAARQLLDAALVDIVADALASSGLAPGMLCLELTESALLEDEQVAAEHLEALGALGVRVAIDDFGTGYSSLRRLKTFAVDYLKVDRSFVDGLGSDTSDAEIVRGVISLGHSLGIDVIAEGAERDAQVQELAALGCRYAQGWFWSRAVPEADVPETILRIEQASSGGRRAVTGG